MTAQGRRPATLEELSAAFREVSDHAMKLQARNDRLEALLNRVTMLPAGDDGWAQISPAMRAELADVRGQP